MNIYIYIIYIHITLQDLRSHTNCFFCKKKKKIIIELWILSEGKGAALFIWEQEIARHAWEAHRLITISRLLREWVALCVLNGQPDTTSWMKKQRQTDVEESVVMCGVYSACFIWGSGMGPALPVWRLCWRWWSQVWSQTGCRVDRLR